MSDEQPKLTPEQEMQRHYRIVFSSAEGRLVLGDIAKMFHLFDAVDPSDAVMNTQRSCALLILQMAGSLDSLYAQLGLEAKAERN